MKTQIEEDRLEGKRLLLVNTGSVRKKFMIRRLKELGVRLVIVNKEKNWAQPYAEDWVLADTMNHGQVINRVGAYLKNHKVDGVMTLWEDDVLLVSKIVDAFGFVGISYDVAVQARNKFMFRDLCMRYGLPAPQYRLLDENMSLDDQVSGLQFPLVIKPVFGAYSSFVVKVEDLESLRRVYSYLQENMSVRVESALHDGDGILVEEYIDGDEVDINLILQRGKIKFGAVTDNFQTEEPFFVEAGWGIPSSLSDSAQKELLELGEMVLDRMGVMDGSIHMEAKFTNKGPVPIEANLRLGADETWGFNKVAWGVDLIEMTAKVACGVYIPKVNLPPEPRGYAVSKSFVPEKSGVISSTSIPQKFNKNAKVVDFSFSKDVGDTVLVPPMGFEYLGWISTYGDTPSDARENLEEALKQIQYEIVPFSGGSAVGKTKRSKPSTEAWLKAAEQVRGRAKIEKVRLMDVKRQRKLRIGIACNAFSGEDGLVEAELASVGKNIQEALQERGYETLFIDFNNLEKAIGVLEKGKVDLVFNVGERLHGSSLLEPHIASLLDAFQIPYTGSNPFTLGLCIDKIRVKKLLNYHEIPTAKWDYVYDLHDLRTIRDDLQYPLIVKPGNSDNSIGITNDSVVTDEKSLENQVRYVLEELKRPGLIEEYLEGDEYDVSILGSEIDDLRVLPLSRSKFHLPSGYWNIYPFESKFEESEIYTQGITIERPPKGVSKKLLSLITEIALDTYTILDCHDYGRVEIKLDREGNPHILELNPNPSINIGDCVPNVAKLTGMDYGDFLEEVVRLAIRRYKDKPPYYHLQPNVGNLYAIES